MVDRLNPQPAVRSTGIPCIRNLRDADSPSYKPRIPVNQNSTPEYDEDGFPCTESFSNGV